MEVDRVTRLRKRPEITRIDYGEAQRLEGMDPSNLSTCPFAAVAQRSGSTLLGTYAAFSCTVAVTGTVSVTKQ